MLRIIQTTLSRRVPLGLRNFSESVKPSAAPKVGQVSPKAEPPKQAASIPTKDSPGNSGSNNGFYAGIVVLLGAGAFYKYREQQKPVDYQEVYTAISKILDNPEYDDGSYGPVLVRLAWHAAGTYDKATNTGGSNGSTMRFNPEASHGANAGLKVARDILEPIKQQFPKISYSDLWSLAGVCAIQEMGGPKIKWRPGRVDFADESKCTPDGRLPNASLVQDHLRSVFYRMGFNDQEIVALAGAHALGRCHTDRSGFEGPWTFSPTTFSNSYFKLLKSDTWYPRKWGGPKQYYDKTTKTLMMLPSDMALYNDWAFSKYVVAYAKDEQLFFKDFAAAFQKLEELGVPFPENTPVYEFK